MNWGRYYMTLSIGLWRDYSITVLIIWLDSFQIWDRGKGPIPFAPRRHMTLTVVWLLVVNYRKYDSCIYPEVSTLVGVVINIENV